MFIKKNIYINYLSLLIYCIVILFVMVIPNVEANTIDKGTIKLAHCQPEIDFITTPYMALTNVFKTIVERDTNDRFKVDVFPNKQMGDSRSEMEQCARGIIEATTGQTTGLIASYYPGIQVLDVPFLFPNLEIANIVLNGDFGKKLEQEIVEKGGLRVLAWMPTGFRNYSNNVREVRSPEDLKGLRIRTMEVPIHIELTKALGANPIPISWEELYTALQTGVVEGCDIPAYLWRNKKLYEVQKYYTLDRHQLNAVAFMVNEEFFQSLSPEDQKIFSYAAREAKKAMMGIVTAKVAGDIAWLRKAGLKITSLTPEEFNNFREIGQSEKIMNMLREKIDPDLIDEIIIEVNKAEKLIESRW